MCGLVIAVTFAVDEKHNGRLVRRQFEQGVLECVPRGNDVAWILDEVAGSAIGGRHCVEVDLTTAVSGSQMIEAGAVGHGVQPGREEGVAFESVEVSEGFQVGVLEGVIHRGLTAEQPIREPSHGVIVAADQLTERSTIPHPCLRE